MVVNVQVCALAALTPREETLEGGASGPVLRQRERVTFLLYPGV
jgi:hypothetical protein